MKSNLKSALAVTICLLLCATIGFAQAGTSGVRGTVVDKEEAPVDSAVVYLKNSHSQDIITHLSDKDGTFRFSGLDLNVDYEIHAEKEGATSASRSISNFDTRKEFVLTLKLDHTKKPSK